MIILSQCILGSVFNIHMLVIIIFQKGEEGLPGQKGPPGSQGPFVSNCCLFFSSTKYNCTNCSKLLTNRCRSDPVSRISEWH